LAGLFLIGLLAISGMPPLNGFASKLLIYESVYSIHPLLSIIALLGSIMLLAIFSKAFASVFLGAPFKGTLRPLPKTMLAVMVAFALAIALIGLFPQQVVELVVQPAANALAGTRDYIGVIL